MSISIIHVITTIDLGGAEKQLLQLATKQQQEGDEVKIVFLKNRPQLLKHFLANGVQVEMEFSQMSFLKQVTKLRREHINGHAVYHAHLPRAELLCALALSPKSFVVTRHNSESFFPKAPPIISRLLSRFVLRRAYASISISRAVTDFLLASKELSKRTINEVVYYGLDDPTVKDRQSSVAKNNFFEIGTVARLVPQKNLPLLINSIAELNQTKPATFHLKILGIGPMRAELKLLTKSLGVAHLVDFQAQSEDVMNFYKSLNLFVLTSNYEGFGLVLLEAMSAGVVVVARNISAIPEVLGNNHPGLFNSDNPEELAMKIWELLSDANHFNKCLLYQSQQLNNFSIDKTTLAHKKIYTKLLEQKVFTTK
jgi:glycosyltransferase involved in cell wall biosynthesis